MWQSIELLQEMNQLCRFLIIMIFFTEKKPAFASSISESISSALASLRTVGCVRFYVFFSLSLFIFLIFSGLHVIYLNSCTIFHSSHSVHCTCSIRVCGSLNDAHVISFITKQGSSSQLSLLYFIFRWTLFDRMSLYVIICVWISFFFTSFFGCLNPLFSDQNKNLQFEYTLCVFAWPKWNLINACTSKSRHLISSSKFLPIHICQKGNWNEIELYFNFKEAIIWPLFK